MSSPDSDDHGALEQGLRLTRQASALTALSVLLAGTCLVVLRPGRDPQVAVGLGGFFLLIGAVYLFWVWRGDWSPPDAERAARQQARVRMVGLVFAGFELLLLTLAFLGLISPERFGNYWDEHRGLVMIASAGLLADLLGRLAQLVVDRRTKSVDSGASA